MPNVVRIDLWDLGQFLGCSRVSAHAISVTISTQAYFRILSCRFENTVSP